MSAETILAAVGAADLCLQYGKRLLRLYQSFKGANDDMKDKILIVESIWSRTEMQVEFTRRIAHTMAPDHFRIYAEVIETLNGKVQIAATRIESLLKKSNPDRPSEVGIKKWKYILVRESLDKTISELEQWQRTFDPTWYLIILIKDRIIDLELVKEQGTTVSASSITSLETMAAPYDSTLGTVLKLREAVKSETASKIHITLSEEGLDWETVRPISYSTTRTIKRAGSDKLFLLDSILCDSSLNTAQARINAESLAKKLKRVESDTFSLLSCHGLVKRKDQSTGTLSSIEFVFRLPAEKVTPYSLRYALLHLSAVSLTTVLSLVRQLAGAVSFVHTCDFVHKNIRPETVLLMSKSGVTLEGESAGLAYLSGFDRFRNINFHTTRSGDVAWERNLYRHPSREGIQAHEDYAMQHDVYSLGVCMLELGLWKSFVDYEEDEKSISGQASKKTPSLALGLSLDDFDLTVDPSLQPTTRIKDHLVKLAKSELPQRVGDKYTSVVVTCLTCLDPGNEDFGVEDNMRDEDGILIGVRFIEKILLRLSEISF